MAGQHLQVLSALDAAKTQWYHFTAIVIAGMGFFTDSYDLFSISLVTKLIGRLYYYTPGSTSPGSLPPNVNAAISGVALCGTFAGQLFFGWIGDKMGRKRVYGVTLILMVVSALASGLSFGHTAKGVVATLCFFRFWLGFGVGGDYPLSATIMSEYANKKTRGRALVAKNAKQAASDMATVLQMEMEAEPEKVERLAMDSSNSYGLFSKEFLRRHGLHLLGTTTTWFFIDIAFYSQSLFQKDIFTDVGWLPSAKTMSALEETFNIARAQTIIALCGTIPGYWFTVAFIDYVGRFIIQLMGFFMMMVFMLGLSIPYNHWKNNDHTGFVVMYALTFFFCNFGPNATTFVVPAEIFPARLRSTCHGISAACGKAGAIIGAFGFLYAAESPTKSLDDKGYPPGIGVQNTLYVLAATDFLGFVFTFFVPEAKGKSLEEMSGDVGAEEGIEME
ncbi:hypothetical protein NE237_007130 [Protea cynaroides]|uniref:Major facilitator superfamily (MFS) profile domain-containing protein n=1 Tax=Protea cynaroides TaxID=273540 RepID=A0A9Q0KPM1_9MAGN|nr:hypothetical protein NE237_007130 [Protea cynaroides]